MLILGPDGTRAASLVGPTFVRLTYTLTTWCLWRIRAHQMELGLCEAITTLSLQNQKSQKALDVKLWQHEVFGQRLLMSDGSNP